MTEQKSGGWVKKVLIGLAVLVLLLVVIIALQPADFKISRKATMAAPPEAPFAQVNDFHNWAAWSPWEKLDPALKRTYEGPAAGTGAIYAWDGNDNVGSGKMTITESKPGELILIKLEFFKPFAATNVTEFTFKPEGRDTVVTWTMTGKNGFIGKAFGLLMNMDAMLGGAFDEGLAKMKTVVEAPPAKSVTTEEKGKAQ